MEALATALPVVVNAPYPFVSFSNLYKHNPQHRQSGQRVTPHLHSYPESPTPMGRARRGQPGESRSGFFCAFLITSLNLKVFGMKPESGSPEAFYHERSGDLKTAKATWQKVHTNGEKRDNERPSDVRRNFHKRSWQQYRCGARPCGQKCILKHLIKNTQQVRIKQVDDELWKYLHIGLLDWNTEILAFLLLRLNVLEGFMRGVHVLFAAEPQGGKVKAKKDGVLSSSIDCSYNSQRNKFP
ncbi:hypothetical protein QQF64_031966 [Cirrhinus molitorella]|uniref:Uncharacterized protein n=1 Tax=Cirrhinus molitorella TaxID=172907 RepID=A0ABR3MYF7_9TELE